MRKNETLIKILAKTFLYLMFVVMFLPIIVLMIFSFTESDVLGNWTGFSFNLYVELFKNEALMSAVGNT